MFVKTEERPAGEPAKVGTLKLSEAIRVGARIRPQGFGGVLLQLMRGDSCAIHAAYEAIEGRPHPDVSNASGHLANWATVLFPATLVEKVIAKNDVAHDSREQIADWLESQGY